MRQVSDKLLRPVQVLLDVWPGNNVQPHSPSWQEYEIGHTCPVNPQDDGRPVIYDSLLLQIQPLKIMQLHVGFWVMGLQRCHDMVDVDDMPACVPLPVNDYDGGGGRLDCSVPIKADAISNPLTPQFHDLVAWRFAILPEKSQPGVNFKDAELNVSNNSLF